MADELSVVGIEAANLDALPCCGIKNQDHEGRRRKTAWLRAHFDKGLKAKELLAPGGRQCGYIEYLPAEYAWRTVEAPGFMFIHCIFTYSRKYQHLGWGAALIEACVSDARKARMNGVAVLVRESPWVAGGEIFLANGFEAVAAAPPDYRLLVKRFRKRAPAPVFRGGCEDRLRQYGNGLTLIHCAQCPHIAKFAGDIAESAERDYGLRPRLVQLESHNDAQNAPTPYAVFSLVYDGRLLADHPVSRTRFQNIMRKLRGAR